MKKLAVLALAFLVGTVAVGCGDKAADQSSDNIIKLGVNGTDFRVWNYVEEELAKQGIDLEVVSFADYIQPNLALANGEIDINSFQTQVYFDQFKEDHKLDLVSIGNTVIAPMGVFSKKYTDVNEIGQKAKIAIPNDVTNGGRALILLDQAGIITLKEGVGATPTVKDIVSNPKEVEIIAMSAQQIPISLQDLDLGVINSGVAVTAGIKPLEESIYIEDSTTEEAANYYNIFAVRKEDENKEELKKLVEVYQTEPVKELLDEVYQGAQVPLF
ncbi:MAG: MetQ/NlpA family ABC transporter substrate-binding protein [Cellulosilyticaceae bacterium]